MNVKIKIEDGAKMPEFKTIGAACADCYAHLNANEITIPAKTRCLIDLGFALELPEGYEAIIRPRSSMSKYGIDSAIGTIDCDYRGIVKACLINNSDAPYVVKNNDRICQLAIRQVEKVEFVQVDELTETERGCGGFGSTGK